MTTKNLENDLKRDEGVETKAYTDTRGIWTIGIGHNIEADPELMLELQHLIDPGIDMAMVDKLFASDVDAAKNQLELHLPWWKSLDDVRQDVLVNMTFNMGINTLLQFRNTLAMMQGGNYADAADGMLASLWARLVGARAQRLARQMRTGIHQS